MSKSMQVSYRAALLCAFALVGCGGSDKGAAAPVSSAGASGSGASGSGASGGSSGTGNNAGTGNVDTSPAGLNPTDCATPGGTPMGTATGTPGTWENVTPSGIDLTPASFQNDNFGVQDVLVDPARPSDAYAFVCHQGVWKSTDYGATWVKVNTGTNGDAIDSGKPWGSNIDSNRCRDPNTNPALYTLNGNGQMGFWKSLDGGVNWTRTELPPQATAQYAQDAYMISVDPYRGHHLLMGHHEAQGLLESNDAGDTWIAHPPGGTAISVYYFFVDTGDPDTTAKTWLALGQIGPMMRTSDAAASWNQVETLEHAHGCSQIFQAGGGVIFAPGIMGTNGDGVYKSTDYGSTWNNVSPGSANNVIGTDTTLYANYAWAYAMGVDPNPRTAPRNPGTQWTKTTPPAGMTNGSKGSAVTFDGTHHVIISGNWNAGIWRYIEP